MPGPERAVLELLEEVVGLLDLDEFYAGLLSALRRALRSDWASLNDVGPGPGDVVSLVEPPMAPELVAQFAALADQNPLIQRYQRTLDGRAYRLSDVATQAEFRALPLYRDFYRAIGVEYQIAFTLPARENRLLGVALSRHHPDYSEDDRAILNRSRPLLIQVFRNAIAHRTRTGLLEAADGTVAERLRARGLSARQAEVLAGVLRGSSRRVVAGEIGISERTLDKHLELAYRGLGVHTRAEAVEAVARLLAPDGHEPG